MLIVESINAYLYLASLPVDCNHGQTTKTTDPRVIHCRSQDLQDLPHRS